MVLELSDLVAKIIFFHAIESLLALKFTSDLTKLVLDLKLTFSFAFINLFFKLLNVITTLLSFFGKVILLFLKILADFFYFSVKFLLFVPEVIKLLILDNCFIDNTLKFAEGLVFGHEFHHLLRNHA